MEAIDVKKGKEYSIGDDKGSKQIVISCKKGVYLSHAYALQLTETNKIFGQASFLLQTKNGEIIITGSETKVIAYSRVKQALLFEGQFKYIYSMTLSPGETYLQILDKIDSNEGRTILFSLPEMTKVIQFRENAQSNYFLKHSYPLVKFTSDDQCYFRYNSKLLEAYDSTHKLVRSIQCGSLEFFKISKISTRKSYLIAALYLDKKTNQGNICLFSDQKDQPLYEKHIKKAEEINIEFSPTSNQFLMELQTYYDPTGKSYYGQYGLYIFNDQNKKITKVNTSKGPVHDFSWDKKGQNFIVISGFMPADSVMFNKKNEVIFEFGKHHKNEIIWGNLGRFVCLAGFGNLSGEMQIWDLQTKTKIGVCKSNSASHCEWSPDDRKLMTGILTPRLRVDNCYKIYSYTGVQIHKANFQHTELYESRWIHNLDYLKQEPKGLSPGRKIGVEEKKEEAKFKSFGAFLGLDTGGFVEPPKKYQEKPKLVPGQHAEQPKKKKRNRNKNEPNLQAS